MVGLVAPSYELVHPSYMIPEIIMPINQASGAFSLLAGGDPDVRIGSEDLVVYARVMDMRSKTTVSQSAGNQLQSISIVNKLTSTPTYMIRARADYDHHDTAAASLWGFGLPDALTHAHRQATWQQMRNAELYGVNPANGEGLVNTQGATLVNLPPDQYGNDTVVTYDNGGMAFFIAQQVLATKTAMMMLGTPARVVICGPQRTLGEFEYNIVQLVQFQRDGAGSESTRGVLNEILKTNLDALEWVYDDTLIGKGASGNDAVILCIPEYEQNKREAFDTNYFSRLMPNQKANTLQLCDMAAPREIISPLAGGATDVLSEMRTTSGWGLRPEGLRIISMQYQ